MYLFLDAVSTKGKLLLTRSDKNIISEKTISLARLESQQLLGKIEEFLDASSVSFSDLSGIIVVHGPGSFTGVRTIVLLVNTLAYMYHIPLFPISFFDMYRSYPIVKASSRRDLFVQLDQDEPIQILSNEAFCAYLEENNIGQVYGDPQMNI
ncbi:MAG: tRNA (adenosine(37)-N6)-threonylcarbamoyltransferase complex dimerization subunit type 1 TsaB [Candidatus Peribacteria bacterium]|nr:MAG: tRNA (adenosine(37)-N6)-threonylcarbamoyltransferase complex dimerization subunit type 1 TsaB [Candidatus Peribacteria bacterium]